MIPTSPVQEHTAPFGWLADLYSSPAFPFLVSRFRMYFPYHSFHVHPSQRHPTVPLGMLTMGSSYKRAFGKERANDIDANRMRRSMLETPISGARPTRMRPTAGPMKQPQAVYIASLVFCLRRTRDTPLCTPEQLVIKSKATLHTPAKPATRTASPLATKALRSTEVCSFTKRARVASPAPDRPPQAVPDLFVKHPFGILMPTRWIVVAHTTTHFVHVLYCLVALWQTYLCLHSLSFSVFGIPLQRLRLTSRPSLSSQHTIWAYTLTSRRIGRV